MKARALLLVSALVGGGLLASAAVPARADEDDWHRHGWQEQYERQHEWRDHDWREHQVYAPPPPVYYAPPPRYYAPPPVVYAPPGVTFGITIP